MYLLFLSDFNETWIFSIVFQKIFQYNFMKICPVGARVFDTDRQMDWHNESNSHFLQFCYIYEVFPVYCLFLLDIHLKVYVLDGNSPVTNY